MGLKTFIPDSDPPATPFNSNVKAGNGKKTKGFDTVTVGMASTIQGMYQKNARMWQIIALVSLTSFFISLGICLYAVRLPKTVPVIVTVNDEGAATYVGRVDMNYWGNDKIPENAKVYQVKKLLNNMYTWVTDASAQNSYIRECEYICQGTAITKLDDFFMNNNPFDYLGLRTQTIRIEPPLRQTDNTYITYYDVMTYESGRLAASGRYSILVTLGYFQGTPETNPLGIYISDFDIKPLENR